MTGTYNFTSHEANWHALPGTRQRRAEWRRPWSVFVSTCKSLASCGVYYSVSLSTWKGATTVQVIADGTPSYKPKRKPNQGHLAWGRPPAMQRCTTGLLEARRDRSAADTEYWNEMIRLTPGANNRVVSVYVTKKSCKKQGAWVDCGYEKAGYQINPGDAKPRNEEHSWVKGKREDLIHQCQRELAKPGTDKPHNRTIARLALHALGEPTNA